MAQRYLCVKYEKCEYNYANGKKERKNTFLLQTLQKPQRRLQHERKYALLILSFGYRSRFTVL